jgi:hypothetical protein
MEGLDYLDLATSLGVSPVAARQRAHRAREELASACMEQAAAGGQGQCNDTRRRLGRYYRGLLTRKTRAQLEHHLATCSSCASCYEQVIDLYGTRSPKEEA